MARKKEELVPRRDDEFTKEDQLLVLAEYGLEIGQAVGYLSTPASVKASQGFVAGASIDRSVTLQDAKNNAFRSIPFDRIKIKPVKKTRKKTQ